MQLSIPNWLLFRYKTNLNLFQIQFKKQQQKDQLNFKHPSVMYYERTCNAHTLTPTLTINIITYNAIQVCS